MAPDHSAQASVGKGSGAASRYDLTSEEKDMGQDDFGGASRDATGEYVWVDAGVAVVRRLAEGEETDAIDVHILVSFIIIPALSMISCEHETNRQRVCELYRPDHFHTAMDQTMTLA